MTRGTCILLMWCSLDQSCSVQAARDAASMKNAVDRNIDWQRCETRHTVAREEEDLGIKRPLTGWEEGRLVD